MGEGSKPRVVKERRRKRAVLEPPISKVHQWAEPGTSITGRIFLSSKCIDALLGHCARQSEDGLEALGFLAGDFFSWEGEQYSVARDAVTTSLDASSVSVRFDRDGFPELFKNLDELGYEYILVGWYHSHPGYGCFMSATDQHTQLSGFSEPFHVALVVDPLRKEMKAYRARGSEGEDGFEEQAIGIYSEEDWPWPGKRKNG